MKPYKRSIYFIDRRYQTKYIVLTLMMLLAYTVTLITMVFAPYVIDLASGGTFALQTEAARTLLALHKRIWPGVIAAMLLFSMLSVYISHQVAGPVYRIKNAMQKILAGDLTSPVHLRHRDDLKDLAECTNLLRNELLTFYSVLRDNQMLLVDYCQLLESNGAGSDMSIAGVQAEIARNQEIIDKYRTEEASC
jgi:methyl-accepting chemotaxis protein